MTQRLLVFTDLDGTLLDHHNYDYSPALPAIAALKRIQADIIINSSKTVAEICQLQQKLQLDSPFISENGALVCLPCPAGQQTGADILTLDKRNYHLVRFGPDYPQLRHHFCELRHQLDLTCSGFGDFSDQQVADLTDLPVHQAAQARQRMASEPILWQDSDSALKRLEEALVPLNLTLVRGGRFHHLAGQSNKGKALEWLMNHYQSQQPDIEWQSVALGDSPNDIAMLAQADIAVAIQPAKGERLQLKQHPHLITPSGMGPVGWNQAILQLLEQFQAKEHLHG